MLCCLKILRGKNHTQFYKYINYSSIYLAKNCRSFLFLFLLLSSHQVATKCMLCICQILLPEMNKEEISFSLVMHYSFEVFCFFFYSNLMISFIYFLVLNVSNILILKQNRFFSFLVCSKFFPHSLAYQIVDL